MFKKAVKVSAQNQLSGKDKKTIKAKLIDYLNEACVEKLFAMNEKIISCKISGSKMLIYTGDQYPLIVDGTGKHNYFPSLYVATAYQPLIKTLILNQGVEAYIYNGANLMWPGVRTFEGLGDFVKDQVIGIRNSKGDIIAIGAMGVGKKQFTDTSGVAVYILHYHGDKLWEMGTKSLPEIIVPLPQAIKQQPKVEVKQQPPSKGEEKKQTTKQTAIKQEKASKQQKGKKQTKPSKKQPEHSPPKKEKTPEQSEESDDGFMNLVHSKTQPKGRVIQMQKKGNFKNAFVEDQNEQNNKKNNKKKGNQPAQTAGKKGGKKKEQSEEEDQGVIEQEEEKPQKENKKGGKKKPQQKGGKKGKKQQQSEEEKEKEKEESGDEKEDNRQKSIINTKLMDEYFKESMLNAIKLTKIQSELPVDSGKFFMDYMIAAKPEGVKLEIKDSSYKKIGKFFEEMSKKKIIQYKHPKDKKAQGAQIIKIFWENEDIKNHVPTIKKLASKQQEQKVQNYSKAKLKLSKTVTLETVYKPNQQLFDNVLKKPLNLMPQHSDEQITDKQEIQYITQKELRQKIEKYINKITQNVKEKQGKQKEKELKKDKQILLDYTKQPFIKNLLKKQIEDYEENKQKDDILKADEGSDEEGDKKKKKNKKGAAVQGLFKVDRGYLLDKLFNKAAPYHHVFDQETGLDKFKQGQFKGIQLVAEKSNNKNVTKISGLELFITPKEEVDDQIHGFANSLQTKFACSVNVQNLPGKGAGKQIIVHGAFLDELQQIFTQEHQLPDKFISTQNKLEKKKKN